MDTADKLAIQRIERIMGQALERLTEIRDLLQAQAESKRGRGKPKADANSD